MAKMDVEEPLRSTRGAPMPWKLGSRTAEAATDPSFFRANEIPEDPMVTCWLSPEDAEDEQYICTDAQDLMTAFDLEGRAVRDAKEVSRHSEDSY